MNRFVSITLHVSNKNELMVDNKAYSVRAGQRADLQHPQDGRQPQNALSRLIPKRALSMILARYIIRACFSQGRMSYITAKDTLDGQAKIIYRSKDGRTSKTFKVLDWSRQKCGM